MPGHLVFRLSVPQVVLRSFALFGYTSATQIPEFSTSRRRGNPLRTRRSRMGSRSPSALPPPDRFGFPQDVLGGWVFVLSSPFVGKSAAVDRRAVDSEKIFDYFELMANPLATVTTPFAEPTRVIPQKCPHQSGEQVPARSKPVHDPQC